MNFTLLILTLILAVLPSVSAWIFIFRCPLSRHPYILRRVI